MTHLRHVFPMYVANINMWLFKYDLYKRYALDDRNITV